MERVAAVIFAGGTGVRMGADKPKQFLEVEGRPIIIHTLDIFEKHPAVDDIFIACKAEYIDLLRGMISEYGISKVRSVVPGGATGMDSIYNGLSEAARHADGDTIVLIHDGVRPICSAKLVDEVIAKVKEHGTAVTCTPMFETPVVSKSGTFVEETPLRADCYTAQAPQAYYLGELIEAHDEVRRTNPGYEGIVDNCSLMKSLGREVAIVKGPRSNIKVTTSEDIYILRAMIEFNRDEARRGEMTE